MLSALAVLLSLPLAAAPPAAAVRAWDEHVAAAGRAFAARPPAPPPEAGSIPIERGPRPPRLAGALIHHWQGRVFLPGVRLEPLLAWVQDYDRNAERFPDVEASQLLRREGDTFAVRMRLARRGIIDVVYETEHRVGYERPSPGEARSTSVAVRIEELDDPGSPKERRKTPDEDRGFLWRLDSFWRFRETPSGVVVECDSLSLSRDVPAALRWLIGPYVESVPRKTLGATLAALRDGAVRDLTSPRSPSTTGPGPGSGSP